MGKLAGKLLVGILKALWWVMSKAQQRWELGWRLAAAVASWLAPHTVLTVLFVAVNSRGVGLPAFVLLAAFAFWLAPQFRVWATNQYTEIWWRLRFDRWADEKIGLPEDAELGSIEAYNGVPVEMVMKPAIPQTAYSRMLEEIQIKLDAEAIDVDLLDTNRVKLTIDYTVLPALYPMAMSDNPDRVLLGLGEGDRPMIWDAVKQPHLGIFGQTGGGKGGVLWVILNHTLNHPARWETPTVISGKPSGELRDFTNQGVRLMTVSLDDEGVDTAPIIEAAEQAWTLMIERLSENEAKGWNQHPGKHVLLAVDDMESLLKTLGTKEAKAFTGKIAAIAAMGRAAGVHLVVMTQKPDVGAVGGGDVLNNVGGRICVGGSRKAIEQALDETPPKLVREIPGRVLYKALDPTKDQSAIRAGQVCFYESAQPQPQDADGDTTSSDSCEQDPEPAAK